MPNIRAILWVLIWMFVWLGLLLALPRLLNAHDAPTGWSYDPSCCNTMDCRQVGSSLENVANSKVIISEEQGGYRVHKPDGTSEIVPYTSKQIRVSKDGYFHWCSTGRGDDNGRTICLYAPPKGF